MKSITSTLHIASRLLHIAQHVLHSTMIITFAVERIRTAPPATSFLWNGNARHD